MDASDASHDGVLKDGRGQLVSLASGRLFPIQNPRPEDFDIYDVAHHLAQVNRFSGATRVPYSVASHLCVCATIATYEPIMKYTEKVGKVDPDKVLRWAFAHDFAEFVIGDHIRPVKRSVPELGKLEAGVMDGVKEWLKLPELNDAEKSGVRFIDNLACSSEKVALLPNSEPWPGMPNAHPDMVKTVTWMANMRWDEVRDKFLDVYFQIFGFERPTWEIHNDGKPTH